MNHDVFQKLHELRGTPSSSLEWLATAQQHAPERPPTVVRSHTRKRPGPRPRKAKAVPVVVAVKPRRWWQIWK